MMKRIIAISAVLILAGAALGRPGGGDRHRGPGPAPGYNHSLVGFLVRCGLDIAFRDCICSVHHVAFERCWDRHSRWERHVGWQRPPARHDRDGRRPREDSRGDGHERGGRPGGGHGRRG
jgi:hypothetical protein